MAAPSQSSASVLNSWKEIASYLGRGVRTVQRYERDLALPIRRPRGTSRSAVIALREDLDAWLRQAPAGDLQKSASSAKTLLTQVQHSIGEGNELRHQCNALRTAHHEVITRLIANLNGMMNEIQAGARGKSDGNGNVGPSSVDHRRAS